MADFKITLTRAVMVNGTQKALQTDVVIENTNRNLGIVEGIDKLLTQASEIVPDEARKYWRECRASGSLQLYEIQSELETRFGISFGCQEVNAAEPSPPPQPHRNGTPEQEPADLDSMLRNQLKVLQARNAVLNASIEKQTAERDKNDANIMRIAQFLAPVNAIQPTGVPALDKAVREAYPPITPALSKKRRGRPPKVQPHVE